MSDSPERIEIPKRALFKASEVCELLKVQPYVLRSWEMEFPELGIAKTAGGPRLYRRGDVEQVIRIKHLLLVDGLTLAGARRKLEEEGTPVAPDAPLDELIGQNARDRLTAVKRGLRAILDILSARPIVDDFEAPPLPRATGRTKNGTRSAKGVDPARGKPTSARARQARKRPA
jgi:DNA-binding transcriptional MerR regulator